MKTIFFTLALLLQKGSVLDIVHSAFLRAWQTYSGAYDGAGWLY